MKNNTVNIFYSWMSDWDKLRTNRQVIKTELKAVISQLEKLNPNIEFYLDEATRDEAGTVHIPLTIENKIREADIFIGDISIINPKSTYRKTPNPNVLYELALASELVDWNNIICIFNDHYGSLKELPFDIGFRRPIIYKLRQKMLLEDRISAKEVKKTLRRDMLIAIQSIMIGGTLSNKIRIRELKKILNDSYWIAYNHGEEQNVENKKGEIHIRFRHGNMFEFTFHSFELNNKIANRFENGDWSANIFLNRDSLSTARLTFESKVDFGFKELIISDNKLLLLGVNLQNEGYGKQVLLPVQSADATSF